MIAIIFSFLAHLSTNSQLAADDTPILSNRYVNNYCPWRWREHENDKGFSRRAEPGSTVRTRKLIGTYTFILPII